MKEATGEANMTVITIVLIGVVAAVGALLIPQLLNSTERSGCCQMNGGIWRDGACVDPADGSAVTDVCPE